MATTTADTALETTDLQARYAAVRGRTLALAAPLSAEDCQVQSMTEASPVKWHLAHTSWFFETFLLAPNLDGYRPYHPGFEYLFNSYYYTVGDMHARPQRGMISRPSLAEVLEYRRWVDEHMERLLASAIPGGEIVSRATLGLAHEEQHQELILTDIKHALWLNPLAPAYTDGTADPVAATELAFIDFPGGETMIGDNGTGFAFDNERPRHTVLLRPYGLADRLVTNGEYREFVRDGGYDEVSLWLCMDDRRRVVGDRCTGTTTSSPNSRCAVSNHWTRMRRSAISVTTKRTRSPAGPARACRPNASGRRRSANPRFGRCSTAAGSGPRVPISPTRASGRRPAVSASTTASS